MQAIPIQHDLRKLIKDGHFGCYHGRKRSLCSEPVFIATAFTFDRWPTVADALVLLWEPVDGWQLFPSCDIQRNRNPGVNERKQYVRLFAELLPMIGKLARNAAYGQCGKPVSVTVDRKQPINILDTFVGEQTDGEEETSKEG